MGVYDSFKQKCDKTGEVDYPQSKLFSNCLAVFEEGDELKWENSKNFILILKRPCFSCGRAIKIIVNETVIKKITCDPFGPVVYEHLFGGVQELIIDEAKWPCPHGLYYHECEDCYPVHKKQFRMEQLSDDNLLVEDCIDKQIAINGKDLFKSPDYFAKCVALRAIRAERKKEELK